MPAEETVPRRVYQYNAAAVPEELGAAVQHGPEIIAGSVELVDHPVVRHDHRVGRLRPQGLRPLGEVGLAPHLEVAEARGRGTGSARAMGGNRAAPPPQRGLPPQGTPQMSNEGPPPMSNEGSPPKR